MTDPKPTPTVPAAGTPWYSGLLRLVKSSKAWVALIASTGAVGMSIHGDVTSNKALFFVQVIVGIYLIAHGIEDAAVKFSSNAKKDPAAALASVMAVVPHLMPLIEDIFKKTMPTAEEIESVFGLKGDKVFQDAPPDDAPPQKKA